MLRQSSASQFWAMTSTVLAMAACEALPPDYANLASFLNTFEIVASERAAEAKVTIQNGTKDAVCLKYFAIQTSFPGETSFQTADPAFDFFRTDDTIENIANKLLYVPPGASASETIKISVTSPNSPHFENLVGASDEERQRAEREFSALMTTGYYDLVAWVKIGKCVSVAGDRAKAAFVLQDEVELKSMIEVERRLSRVHIVY